MSLFSNLLYVGLLSVFLTVACVAYFVKGRSVWVGFVKGAVLACLLLLLLLVGGILLL